MKDYLGISLAALVIVLSLFAVLTLQRGLPERASGMSQEQFVQSQGNAMVWKR